MQTAREHPRQSGAIGPSDPPAESFIPQTGGPGNASFSFVSLATAASFGFGLKTILLDHDRGNDAGMSRSVPRPGRIGVAGAPPLRCGGICPAAGGDTEGEESRAAPMGAQQSRAARPQPIALHRPRLEAHEKSPGRRNRKGAEKVREDHQGDKAPPVRRPTRKRHNHSLNLWYDCASKRPNGTQFTFLGRFCCFQMILCSHEAVV